MSDISDQLDKNTPPKQSERIHIPHDTIEHSVKRMNELGIVHTFPKRQADLDHMTTYTIDSSTIDTSVLTDSDIDKLLLIVSKGPPMAGRVVTVQHVLNLPPADEVIGMHGKMPKITIGDFTICMMHDKPNCDKIWVERTESGSFDGSSFDADLLEPFIKEFYAKHF